MKWILDLIAFVLAALSGACLNQGLFLSAILSSLGASVFSGIRDKCIKNGSIKL